MSALGADRAEARKTRDYEHLRASQAPGNAQIGDRQAIAQSMLEVGRQTPILVRRDGDRFVLLHGLHRLEACKALGEETIDGYLVDAPNTNEAPPRSDEAC